MTQLSLVFFAISDLYSISANKRCTNSLMQTPRSSYSFLHMRLLTFGRFTGTACFVTCSGARLGIWLKTLWTNRLDGSKFSKIWGLDLPRTGPTTNRKDIWRRKVILEWLAPLYFFLYVQNKLVIEVPTDSPIEAKVQRLVITLIRYPD